MIPFSKDVGMRGGTFDCVFSFSSMIMFDQSTMSDGDQHWSRVSSCGSCYSRDPLDEVDVVSENPSRKVDMVSCVESVSL